MNTTKDLWTVVTRDKGGRFFRPVDGSGAGTWAQAAEAARTLGAHLDATLGRNHGVDIWYVPAQGTPVHAEDLDNILVGDTKRIPIRWDAEPKHSMPTPALVTVTVTEAPTVSVERRDCAMWTSHRIDQITGYVVVRTIARGGESLVATRSTEVVAILEGGSRYLEALTIAKAERTEGGWAVVRDLHDCPVCDPIVRAGLEPHFELH